MQIAALLHKNPLVLAPLAGYSDLPFRLLCRRFGAGLCYTEMVSCHGLVYDRQKTVQLTRSVPEERPVALQLFGADPEKMGKAAAIASEMGIDIIDINMGCPVKKVVKKGAGAGLMKTPDLAAAIIRRVCASTSLPVSVKIRLGWTPDTLTAPQFARMAEENGASLIAVHGRTWSQGFGGDVDWQSIASVKKSVAIPVIGNGDITSHRDALDKLARWGCDGVMIGRGAMGNPWIFSPADTPGSLSERCQGLLQHLELIRLYYSEPDRMLARIKNHAGRYFKGITGGSAFRRRIYAAPTFDALQNIIS
ncbi:MAG: tRNA dihydrouridine synthase DusB [Deltaproteobacteria bacterium]|nr:tRNA dihydrouridine synthase DusB [Deltaproteobacteria bacterium]MBW2521350.1 tRNA dihydrouridine synthase DusB [Deltaproteobacteria bacterium]